MFKRLCDAAIAQYHKASLFIWRADPVAQMRLEYDRAVARLRTARDGLERYRALVEQSARRAGAAEARAARVDEEVRAFLAADDREGAGRAVLRLDEARQAAENARADAVRHEEGYSAHLEQIRVAAEQLAAVRMRIGQHDAELRMAGAEGEAEALARSFDLDPLADFSELEAVVRDRIDVARARVRVGHDLAASRTPPRRLADPRDKAAEKARGEMRLREYEQRLPAALAVD